MLPDSSSIPCPPLLRLGSKIAPPALLWEEPELSPRAKAAVPAVSVAGAKHEGEVPPPLLVAGAAG